MAQSLAHSSILRRTLPLWRLARRAYALEDALASTTQAPVPVPVGGQTNPQVPAVGGQTNPQELDDPRGGGVQKREERGGSGRKTLGAYMDRPYVKGVGEGTMRAW